MAKFYGAVGYVNMVETAPGVWREVEEERNYFGDILKNNRRWETGKELNDNLTINNTVTIIADPYAYLHFHTMRYIRWMGACWKITNVEVQRPRLILTIGGVYNEQKANSSQPSCRDTR